MYRHAFTLLELIVVIIIIGILASLGFVAYSYQIEKARDVEAVRILSGWLTLVDAYYLEQGWQAIDTSVIVNNLRPAGALDCSPEYYFRYSTASYVSCGGGFVQLTATRCTSNGKEPQAAQARYVYIRKSIANNSMVMGKSDIRPNVSEACP